MAMMARHQQTHKRTHPHKPSYSALGPPFPISDGAALWAYNGLVSLAYAYYVLGAIADICHYLDVHCLTIHPRQRAKAT